jgi:uncharacterized membrane protein YhaH (DUF805 family)
MDSSSGSDNAALGFMAAYFGILGIIALAFLALFIWIYWRILSRAGFSGALALLCLVPGVGALIPILILAFGRWPIEDQLAALQAGHPMPYANPNPFSPAPPAPPSGPPATQ